MLEDSPAPLLSVENLAIDFRVGGGVFPAVREVSFSVDRGGSLAIIGESGSGKTVTASAILGLLDTPPAIVRSGKIRFRGEDLLRMGAAKRRSIYGRDIAVVFQDPLIHLNPVYPVGWQIAEVCRIHGMSAADAKARGLDLLHQVGIPNPARRAGDYPHEFSGGQRQRIMIAMAMALRPALLIADEPTTALDVTVQARILDLLRAMQQEAGTALILITHDLGVAADMADNVLVMREGEFVERGEIRRVFREPTHAYTRQLLSARNGAPSRTATGAGETLLEVRSLVVSYGGTRAVDDVSLSLRKNEIVCVVGESGSGKSTLANAILGLKQPSSGVVSWRSRDIAAMSSPEHLAWRRALQAVFQDPFSSLNPRMSVREIIAEPWTIHRDVVPKAGRRARAAELLERVGLSAGDLDKYPTEFSGGQRQRIAIARALALESEVVVCDEAVSSLDMSVQAQVIALLAELRARLGVAFLFITHDLTLVRTFADRVIVMRDGKIVEEGATASIFDRPRETYTQTLIAATPVPDPDEQRARRLAFQALGAGKPRSRELAGS